MAKMISEKMKEKLLLKEWTFSKPAAKPPSTQYPFSLAWYSKKNDGLNISEWWKRKLRKQAEKSLKK